MRPRFAAVGLVLLLVMSPIVSHAQHGGTAPAVPGPAPTAMADMMRRHAAMFDESKRADEALAALVAKMNAETGSAKQDAIAAVVTELARRQTAMHARMTQMHGMMSSMMQHRGATKDETEHKH